MKNIFLSICIIAFAIEIFGQVQIGQDINGEAAGDQFGSTVSMPDDTTIAIGSRYNDGNGTDAGHVRVFTWNGSEWIQKGIDIDGKAAGDWFGTSVSMSDENTLAVGAPGRDSNGIDAGQVCVFKWDGLQWVQQGSDIVGEAAEDYFGYNISMPDTNTIAIGAPGNDANGEYAGSVSIFKWDGLEWIQKGANINGEAAGDYSSYDAVSMSDSSTVAIGASQNDGNGTDSGHAHVFKWNGSEWIQKGSDIDGEYANDLSGISVSMPDSNFIAIGAEQNDDNGTSAGHVRIFRWDGSAWIQKGSDIDGEEGDVSGGFISMADTNTLAITSLGKGLVRIYCWDGINWIQKGKNIEDEVAGDYCGWGVNMPNANTVAVGSISNDNNGTDAGQARIFSLCKTTSIDVVTACNSYTWIDGNTYTESNNTATYVIPNAAGCDSIITLNLTINTVDKSVTNAAPTLTSNATDATYKWLDCNDNMSIIAGETSQSFTPTANGSYAVEITQNDCVDTSNCEIVNNLSILENSFENSLIAYPNPTTGAVSVDLTDVYKTIDVEIKNYLGQVIKRQEFSNTNKFRLNINEAAGIYLIEIKADDKRALIKVIKE